jgi:dolichol-phosphate mannosyltransferase
MSGFFAFKKKDLPPSDKLSPIGYKIALEILVKGNFNSIIELPIFFKDRQFGRSKLSLKEQIKYLRHIRRLYIYKFPKKLEFIQFAIIATGMALFFYVLFIGFQY